MTKGKNDARVRYTKLMIRNSFISLLSEKPQSKISVTDICALAGINRATFYAHYRDPADLMESLETELMEKIVSALTESLQENGPDLTKILPNMLAFIESQADICLVLMNDLSEKGFVHKIMELLEGSFVSSWVESYSISEELAGSLFLFSATGSVGLLRKWLENGCRESPEHMGRLIISLFSRGASAFEGEPQE